MAKNDQIMSALQAIMSRLDDQDKKIAAVGGLIPSNPTVETVETVETDDTDDAERYTIVRETTIAVHYAAQNGKSVQVNDKDGPWIRSAWRKKGAMTGHIKAGDMAVVGLNAEGLIVSVNGTMIAKTAKETTPKVTTPKVTTPKVTTPKVTTPKVTVETVIHDKRCRFCGNVTRSGNPHSNEGAVWLQCAARQWAKIAGRDPEYVQLDDSATWVAFVGWSVSRPAAVKVWAPNKHGWRYIWEASQETVKTAPAAQETAPAVKTGRGGPRDRCQGCNLYVKTGQQYHDKCRPVPTPPTKGKGKGSRKATQPTITTVATTANAAQESTAALAPTVASELTWEDKLAAVKHPTSSTHRVTFVKSCDNPEKSDKDRSRPLIKVHSPEFAGHPNQDVPGIWLRASDTTIYQKIIGKPKNAVWNVTLETMPGKSGGPVTYITKATQDRKSPAPDVAGLKSSGKDQPPVPAKKRQDDTPSEKRAALRKSGKGTAGQISTARLAGDLCPKCSRRFSMVGRDASGLLCTVCAATA